MSGAQVVLRAACSSEIGTGHLRRCLTLASQLRTSGLDVSILADDTAVTRSLAAAAPDHSVGLVPAASLPDVDVDSTAAVVFDLPTAPAGTAEDRDLRRRIAELDRAGVSAISLGHSVSDSGHLRAVIDLYPATRIAAVNYLEGPEFLILRPEFHGRRRSQLPDDDRLLVAMGGTDPLDLTGAALRALGHLGYQGHVHVVVGSGHSSDPGQVQDEAAAVGLDAQVHVELAADEMAQLMLTCRAGVVAFGTTAYELMALGVPVLAFTHYPWQAESAQFFENQGAMYYLGGAHDAPSTEALGERLAPLLSDDSELSRRGQRGADMVDGQGARRVAELIEGFAEEADARELDHLYVLAHPGDEVFGCGATILQQVRSGERVGIAILGEGTESRQEGTEDPADIRDQQEVLKSALQQATEQLGVAALYYFRYPDNRFDAHDLLDLVKTIEVIVERHRPRAVYTHHPGDLNVDHRLTFEAVATAVRPRTGSPVQQLFSIEVPSSSDWGAVLSGPRFDPNWLVDVGNTLDDKLDLARLYTSEIRSAPHPRSPEGLRVRAAHWGQLAGVAAAEAFVLHRHVQPESET